MGVFWYYCNNCGIKFSWVFTGVNDCKACTKCHSKDIVRITNEMIKEVKLNGRYRENDS